MPSVEQLDWLQSRCRKVVDRTAGYANRASFKPCVVVSTSLVTNFAARMRPAELGTTVPYPGISAFTGDLQFSILRSPFLNPVSRRWSVDGCYPR